MFNDFLQLNYEQTKNKLQTIRKLINRIGAEVLPHAEFIFNELELINSRLNRFNFQIQSLSQTLKQRKALKKQEEQHEEDEELLPDLIVLNINSTELDHYIDFEITVKNIGTLESTACKLNVNIPSKEESNVELDIPALEINGTTTLHHQYSFDKNSVEPKEIKTIVATADFTNINRELNEQNNTTSIQFESLPQSAGVIVHIHNPEGLEIGSILGGSIYEHVGITISNGITIPIDESTHGIPTVLSAGNYNIQAQFNEITQETGTFTIETGVCYEIFFTFPRTEKELIFSANCSKHSVGSWSLNDDEDYDYYETFHDCIWDIHHQMKVWSYDVDNVTTGTYDIESNIYLTQNGVDIDVTAKANAYFYNSSGYGDFGILIGNSISSENYFTKDISFNISSNSNFKKWFVQQLNTEESFGGKIYSDIPSSEIIFTQYIGYYMKTLYAYKHYTDLGVYVTPSVECGYTDYDFSVDEWTLNINKENSYEGSTLLKMSSTPYDIEGTAV